jgi:hypothetical protein
MIGPIMDRVAAYSMISRKLREYQFAGYDTLTALLDCPPTEEIVQVGGNPIIVAVRVMRARNTPGRIIVEASAYGQNGSWEDQVSDCVIVDHP